MQMLCEIKGSVLSTQNYIWLLAIKPQAKPLSNFADRPIVLP